MGLNAYFNGAEFTYWGPIVGFSFFVDIVWMIFACFFVEFIGEENLILSGINTYLVRLVHLGHYAVATLMLFVEIKSKKNWLMINWSCGEASKRRRF